MKIVAAADPHGSLYTLKIPECDLLLLAGDVCPVDQSHEPSHQRKWLRNTFTSFLIKQPTERVVWIGGNHDFVCEEAGFYQVAQEISDNVRARGGPFVEYLQDTYTTIEHPHLGTLKIWGSPWVPNLHSWAFYSTDDAFQLHAANILEEQPDILLLHGPPKGILDGISFYGHVGAPHMASAMQQALPRLVVFGHIHEGYGTEKIGDVEFANVAHMDEDYRPINPPMVFEL